MSSEAQGLGWSIMNHCWNHLRGALVRLGDDPVLRVPDVGSELIFSSGSLEVSGQLLLKNRFLILEEAEVSREKVSMLSEPLLLTNTDGNVVRHPLIGQDVLLLPLLQSPCHPGVYLGSDWIVLF